MNNYPFYDNYYSLDDSLKIRFEAPQLDLREVALVGSQLHRLVNKVAAYHLDFPYRNYQSTFPAEFSFGRGNIPLLVSLEITELSFS